jgi:hypothetical protein
MLPRERVGPVRWDTLQLDQVTALPDSLCRACALRAIVPALRRYPEFSNGLGCPYNGEGVFVTLQL